MNQRIETRQVDGRWVVTAGRAVLAEHVSRASAVEEGAALARSRGVEHVVHYAQRVIPDDPSPYEVVA